MNPALWLARRARLDPGQPALLRGETVIADYDEFARRAAVMAGALTYRHDLKPGDRVAVFMGNAVEYLEILYGIWWAGAVAVPINAKLHAREAAWIMAHSGAGLVFTDSGHTTELTRFLPQTVRESIAVGSPAYAGLLEGEAFASPVPMADDAMAWLFYTSGTTGRPKGVMITCANLHAMTHSYFVDVDSVEPADAILYAAPMSHGAGLYNFMHVLRGAQHVVPESGGFDPGEILDLTARLAHVSMFAAPTMVRRLVDRAKAEGRTGQGIKTIVYGGGPMYLADIVEAVEVMGPRFVQIYGQGESPMTITSLPRHLVADRSHPRWRQRLASVGSAQSCVEVRIAGTDGNTVPAGTTGEILVRGRAVMGGYWNNPEATAAAIKDGWLWTGDLGAMDEDGFVTLQDRSKDVIISGGTNIYPREVEEALLLHESVHEAAVVGRPHAEWGEEVVAFVTALPGAEVDAATLDRHCLEHIARFKRPKSYRFVDTLPKNNYGKVLKTELRQMLKDLAS